MSLRVRLLLALAPLFVAGLLIADIATYAALNNYLISQLDEQILTAHEVVAQQMAGFHQESPGGPPVGVPNGTYGAVLSPSGAVITQRVFAIAGSNVKAGSHPQLPPTLTRGPLTVNGVGGYSRYRLYVDTNEFNNAPYAGDLLVVGVPLDTSVDPTLHQLLILELLVSGGVTIVINLATISVVRHGLRPLERMADTARVAASDLSRRVEPSTEKTEVGRLGLALNSMLAQLEAAFAERRRNEQRLRHFISDASHELRTPLTSMQGYAELVQRAPTMDRDDLMLAMRRMEEETKRMGLLVDNLLLLARLDQGRPLERQPVDLEALVLDACADARAADAERSITARISAPLQTIGDEMRLRQVLANLMRNAVVHTPPETPVEVALHDEGSDAVIDVIDHGRGIPAAERDRVFERFHRSDPGLSADQGGSGLGLSIVAAVVAAHRGDVRLSETPGGGATFTVRLPLRADAQMDASTATVAGAQRSQQS